MSYSHDHNHSHNHEHTAKVYEVKLIDKKEVAEGTTAFSFEKPEGLTYRAGQHAKWTLINPSETDAEGNSRIFSLVSAPSEEKLTITTRMRDTAFKRTLGKMNIGDTLKVADLHGSFLLHNDETKPAVFLIGGIGITPILSIIKDATVRKLPHKLTLFYSNKTPGDAPYLHELEELAKQNPEFKLVATMTQIENSESWSGETGYIDRPMLEKYMDNLEAPLYYLSGPQVMVQAMRKLLTESGINEDNIRSEEFSGY